MSICVGLKMIKMKFHEVCVTLCWSKNAQNEVLRGLCQLCVTLCQPRNAKYEVIKGLCLICVNFVLIKNAV